MEMKKAQGEREKDDKRLVIFETAEWSEWTVVALSLRITKDRRKISDELYLLYRGMFANA